MEPFAAKGAHKRVSVLPIFAGSDARPDVTSRLGRCQTRNLCYVIDAKFFYHHGLSVSIGWVVGTKKCLYCHPDIINGFNGMIIFPLPRARHIK